MKILDILNGEDFEEVQELKYKIAQTNGNPIQVNGFILHKKLFACHKEESGYIVDHLPSGYCLRPGLLFASPDVAKSFMDYWIKAFSVDVLKVCNESAIIQDIKNNPNYNKIFAYSLFEILKQYAKKPISHKILNRCTKETDKNLPIGK